MAARLDLVVCCLTLFSLDGTLSEDITKDKLQPYRGSTPVAWIIVRTIERLPLSKQRYMSDRRSTESKTEQGKVLDYTKTTSTVTQSTPESRELKHVKFKEDSITTQQINYGHLINNINNDSQVISYNESSGGDTEKRDKLLSSTESDPKTTTTTETNVHLWHPIQAPVEHKTIDKGPELNNSSKESLLTLDTESDNGQSGISQQVPGQSEISQQVPGQSGISQQVPGQSGISQQVPGQSGISQQVPGQSRISQQDPGDNMILKTNDTSDNLQFVKLEDTGVRKMPFENKYSTQIIKKELNLNKISHLDNKMLNAQMSEKKPVDDSDFTIEWQKDEQNDYMDDDDSEMSSGDESVSSSVSPTTLSIKSSTMSSVDEREDSSTPESTIDAFYTSSVSKVKPTTRGPIWWMEQRNTDSLLRNLSSLYSHCDNCMQKESQPTATCTYFDHRALELQKWFQLFVHFLRFGCSVPDVDTTSRCCHKPLKEVNDLIVHMTELFRDLQNVMFEQCNKCPVDCQMENWGAWSDCPFQCATQLNTTHQSRQKRTRSVRPHRYGGDICTETTTETRDCPLIPSDQATWTSWSSWSHCEGQCHGVSFRSRQCQIPSNSSCFLPCGQNDKEFKKCSTGRCCEPREWESWGSWSSCALVNSSVSQRTRYRSCDGPTSRQLEHLCSEKCVGRSVETSTCCNPTWESWTPWTSCTSNTRDLETDLHCGSGWRNRTRQCKVNISKCTESCNGNSTELMSCQLPLCCVPPVWSEWQSWGSCSVTTGHGIRKRHRSCSSDKRYWRRPTCRGQGCDGQFDDSEEERCNGQCAATCVPASWSNWGVWTDCLFIDNIVQRTRSRQCVQSNNVRHCPPTNCTGHDQDVQCCCDDPMWSNWGSWSDCDTQLYQKTRTRECMVPAKNIGQALCNQTCTGIGEEHVWCEVFTTTTRLPCLQAEWGEWGVWSECQYIGSSVQRKRSRDCIQPHNYLTHCPATNCTGQHTLVECCCGDPIWTNWSSWSECVNKIKIRVRECMIPAKNIGQSLCPHKCKEPMKQTDWC